MPSPQKDVDAYLRDGRIPWSRGYKPYRSGLLQRAVADAGLREAFAAGAALPAGWAFGVDERAVEYPWALARLDAAPGRVLDAGSTLNQHWLLDSPALRGKDVVISTLVPERALERGRLAYVTADLRAAPFRDGAFDAVVCISTLEHVGLDNARIYSGDPRHREDDAGAWRTAIAELRRVLAPGGLLLLTVPFGRRANLGWMQQFDAEGVGAIVAAFGPAEARVEHFRYAPAGWERASAGDCAACEYFDVHSAPGPAGDRAAAARAVACLELRPRP